MYILSVQTHNIRNIFLTAVKQANCFNNIVFILVMKISSKKVCKKNGKELNIKKGLSSVEQERRAVAVVGATFDSKVAFLRTIRKKNLMILKSLQKQSLTFFVLFVCRCGHLSCQISIESVRKIIIYNIIVLKTVLYLKFYSIL